MKNHLTLEEGILILQKKSETASISIEEILHILSGKGQSLILLFLSLPFCQPLQIPGLSTPFGLAIAFIGLRMAFGKRVWLPRRVLAKKMSPFALKKIIEKTLWLIRKIKRLAQPRLTWLCHYPALHLINGLLIALLGIFLALPLPIPLSNLTAAWAIFFIELGLLENDGIFVLIGYLISLLTFGFCITVALSIKFIF